MAVNTIYLDKGILKSAARAYSGQEPRNIRLGNFFQKAVLSLLQKKLENCNYKAKFHPYKYKYSTTSLKEISSFLNGRYFGQIARAITGIKNYGLKYEIRKFEAGDYTLLHDAEKEKEGVDFIMDFTKKWDDFGGYTVYLTEKEELLRSNPCQNALSFIERKKGVMKYTKYATHKQKNPIVQAVGTILTR
ncbi:hypothetical protein HYX08_03060 [Candidatus Woesearchaeota archaeon]|nr:hypothetical protein [Candidatus Woesearchaeota archaeon]